ncbi:MAG TPA: DNA polymerase/3'-5' exonuclease PolX [Gemmatimonadales bacterium]|nr:DNA polymerase/3'-5' exonuclease PolX [Gemmatimonadales bacterium]
MAHTPMDKKAVAKAFERIAALLELKGENPFRVRAFTTAERAIGDLPGTLAEALADGSLAGTKGIGPATLQIVQELVQTGRSTMLEELQDQVPPGLLEMLQISGLGVAKVRQIHETLKIETIAELEEAAREGTLAKLPRFGAKTADNILKGIAFLRQASAFRLAHHAHEEADRIARALAALPGVLRVEPAGEVRRRSEVVREIVLVVVADVPPVELFDRLAKLPGVAEFSGRDERQVTIRFASAGAARIVVTTPANAGATLVGATGSDAHLERLTAHAKAHGHSFDGSALWKGSVFVPTPDEAALYGALGLSPIPPELREGGEEVARAAAGTIPRLLERQDLVGFLHCHSNYSDGGTSIEELALACKEAGYAWLGLTDHSQAAAYAGGLSPDKLQRQADEIDTLNAKLSGIRILKGIEADILQDGSVDYDDAVLARLDFVIASIHSRFGMTRDEMTTRICRAMENPRLTILGHLTGRLLLSREAYQLDQDRIFEEAGKRGVAIEINADPHRLDLDWRVLPAARKAGVRISLGADAHNIAGIRNMEYGVGIARKGWLTREEMLNCLSADDFLAFARSRR